MNKLFDHFGARDTLPGTDLHYYRLDKLAQYGDVSRLPFSIKVLLEALLRTCDGYKVMPEDVEKLLVQLYLFVQNPNLGQVFVSPIDVNLADMRTVVQPDLLYIAADRLNIIEEQKIEGAPDLVVEILSPGTAVNDRIHKFKAYAQAEIKEYWLIDPNDCAIETHVLRGNAYALLDKFQRDQPTRSEVLPGFSIKPAEIRI
ncbi:MAG: Uma2 family endonuclease [Ardenticatenaceae bacterium]|nr:Uma2 family endonuclease [Ardenticatenaceae bacterium]